MTEPDDFGLPGVATLAHIARVAPAPGHSAFWTHWHQTLAALRPRLVEFRAPSPDSSDTSATHWFESIGHVRIGTRLIEPPRGVGVKAGLLTLHGYHAPGPLSGEDEEWVPLARRGVLVVAMRVRGFPGSRLDCADFCSPPGGWISRGLDAFGDRPQDLMGMALAQGAADVAGGLLALRAELDHRAPGQRLPLMLHGWSFGGGIGTIAAGQLAVHAAHACRVDRAVLGLPSLGDWPWRLAQGARAARHGAGADVRATLVAHAAREPELAGRLALFDAALHARTIICPVLAMLALRDEVVPAPSAAAIVNALGTPPGARFRFLAPYGHFDGGLRNARRHAMFPACRDDFLDPALAPTEAMARWAGLLERGERRPA